MNNLHPYLLNLINSPNPNFGWLEPKNRTEEQKKLNFDLINQMPSFKIYGGEYTAKENEQSQIWDCVRKLNNGKNLKCLYQQVGSCFPAGSMVLMADGTEKAIENIKIGDEVVTHKNRVRKVTELFKRNYTGKLYNLTIQGLPKAINTTWDHLIFTYENTETQDRIRDGRFQAGKSYWKPACNFENRDRVLIPYGMNNSRYQKIVLSEFLSDSECEVKDGYFKIKCSHNDNKVSNEIIINEKFARLLGLYLAEGGARKHSESGLPCGIDFTFGRHEPELVNETMKLISEVFELSSKDYYWNSKPTSTTVRCDATVLGRLFYKLTEGNVYTKKIPEIIFKSPKSVKMALLQGWLDGDGNDVFTKERKRVVGVTASSNLASGLVKLAISCNLRPFYKLRKQMKHQRVASQDINFYSNDILDLYPKYNNTLVKVSKPKYTKLQEGFLAKVNSVSYIYVVDLPVYNIEVEEDHSYVVENVAVHNCVGHGKCNAEWYLMHVQCVIGQKREVPILPYEPYGYAQSRVCAGISGYSDGSTGTGAADAARKYGVLSSEISGLPAFKNGDDTITFSGDVDKSWGNRGAPSQYIPEGQKHLVKTTALIRSVEEAKQALLNNYPLTIASSWGGQMTPPLKGNPQVRLNSRVTSWAHQMSVTNYWLHPSLGDIFYIQNSWSASAHGIGPNNEPLGGFWVLASDLAIIIREEETFAYSQFDGFPANRIDPKLFLLI